MHLTTPWAGFPVNSDQPVLNGLSPEALNLINHAKAHMTNVPDGHVPWPEGNLDELRLEALIRRVRGAMVASCECMTKTPDPKYHKPECLYRILSDVEWVLMREYSRRIPVVLCNPPATPVNGGGGGWDANGSPVT